MGKTHPALPVAIGAGGGLLAWYLFRDQADRRPPTAPSATATAAPAPHAATRGAAAGPGTLGASHADALALWHDLKRRYVALRGSTPDRNNKAVPRTTNLDVMRLAVLWTRELAKVKPRDGHERGEHRLWSECMRGISARVEGAPHEAEYTDNERFWQRCSQRLAIYLTSRKARPSRWQLAKESLADSLAGLPSTLERAGRAATGAAARAARTPLTWAAIGVGGAVLLPPVIRAVRK